MSGRLGILHLTTFLQGGAGRAIVDLACAQHAAGHHVTVVTSETSCGEFGNYPEHLQRLCTANVPLLTGDSLFVRDRAPNLRVVEMLTRAVDAASLDILHAHAAVPACIGEAYAQHASRDIPLVQTQHGWGINKTADQAAFDIDVLCRVDQVIATSRATAAQLAGFGVPARAISVVPCGLPATPPADPPPAARRALQPLRDRGLAVAGCIGSVTSNKNQHLLIEALRHTGDLPVALAFVGDGSEPLIDRARERGLGDRVVACGYQPEASRWLPLFDLLAVPSRTEGQGVVVLEAFRAGVPVVASHIPALAELVEDGRTGLLFECGNASALADALRRALTLTAGQRTAIVESARRRFAADFSVEGMVARHEQLYRSLHLRYAI